MLIWEIIGDILGVGMLKIVFMPRYYILYKRYGIALLEFFLVL